MQEEKGSGIFAPTGEEFASTDSDEPTTTVADDGDEKQTINGHPVVLSREHAQPGDVDELGVPWFYPPGTKNLPVDGNGKEIPTPVPPIHRKKWRNQQRGVMRKQEREMNRPMTKGEMLSLIESLIDPMAARLSRLEFSFLALKTMLQSAGYFKHEEFQEAVSDQVQLKHIAQLRERAKAEGVNPDHVEAAIRTMERVDQFECAGCGIVKVGKGKTQEINIDKSNTEQQVMIKKYCEVCREVEGAFFCSKCRRDKTGDFLEVPVSEDVVGIWCSECIDSADAKGDTNDTET